MANQGMFFRVDQLLFRDTGHAGVAGSACVNRDGLSPVVGPDQPYRSWSIQGPDFVKWKLPKALPS